MNDSNVTSPALPTIVIGSDHAGFDYRRLIAQQLEKEGHPIIEHGPATPESTDYPQHAAAVAYEVATHKASLGVLVCGSGVGMSIAANKIRGVRAALCWDVESAGLARAHNDANIMCLGQRTITDDLALAMVEAFIHTPHAGGRHARRVAQIHELEND
jgi:ribose 5-phosphate isomerase B